MSKLQEALTRLQEAVSKSKAKNKAQVSEAVSQLQSYLVFLNSSSISTEATRRLVERVRKPLVPVYAGFSQAALNFAAALSQEIYDTKILSEFTAGRHEQKLLWNSVLDSLLSGVLDFHDEHINDKTKEAIGAALYATLCSLFFSVSITHMSTDLRCTGYTLLSECAEGHKGNQRRLRDQNVLGGTKLGRMLWRTREYLVIENILNLFARMIPPTNGKASGRAERSAFIRSVFVQSSPDDVKTGEQLSKMLENVASSEWDQTASKIMDVLASSNIAFPQPFKIADICACGDTKPSDRLFVDDKGFVANVFVEDDMYETLSVLYSSVRKIAITYHLSAEDESNSNPSIVVSLRSPPTLGREVVHPKVVASQALEPSVVFVLERDDVPRFHEALKSRGLNQAVKINKNAKSSVAESPTKLEMSSAGKLLAKDELEKRVENLSQLYGTNDTSDDTTGQPAPAEDDITPKSPTDLDTPRQLDPQQPPADHLLEVPENNLDVTTPDRLTSVPAAAALSSGTVLTAAQLRDPTALSAPALDAVDDSAQSLPTPKTPVRPSASQTLHDKVFGASSDEELSDVESIPDPPERPRKNQAKAKAQVEAAIKQSAVLPLDDDASMSSPSQRPVRHSAKKPAKRPIVISSDEGEIEDILPDSKILDSSISRRRSVLRMSPLPSLRSRTSTAPTKSKATKPAVPKVPGKTDTTGDNLQQPPGRQLRKPALATIKETSASNVDPLPSSSPPQDPDPIIESSPSPTPVRTSNRKSLKSALRKKDGTLAEPAKSARIQQIKRKRSQDEEEDSGVEDNVHTDSPRKRTKQEPSEVHTGVQSEQTESQVLKPRNTAATRATKRYRAKKVRSSSPADPAPASDVVDFDEIPEGPASSLRESKHDKPATTISKKAHKQERSVRNADTDLGAKATAGPKRTKKENMRASNKKSAVPIDKSVVSSPNEGVKSAGVNDEDVQVKEPTRKKPAPRPRRKVVESPPPEPLDVPTEVVQLASITEEILPSRSPSPPVKSASPIPSELPQVIPSPIKHSTPKARKAPWNEFSAKKTIEQDDPPPANQEMIDDAVQEAVVIPDSPVQTAAKKPTEAVPRSDKSTRAQVSPQKPLLLGNDPPTLQLRSQLDKNATAFKDSPALAHSTPKRRTVVIKTPTPSLEALEYTEDVEIVEAEEVPAKHMGASISTNYRDPAKTTSTPTSRQYRAPSLEAVTVERAEEVEVVEAQDVPAERQYTSNPTHRRHPVETVSTSRQYRGKANLPSTSDYKVPPMKVPVRSKYQDTQGFGRQPELRERSPTTEDLASVLEELNHAILRKVTGRIEGVRHSVRVGRDQLMADAVEYLLEMQKESIDNYNNLIDLEAEYATFCRNLTHGFQDVVQADKEVCDNLRKIIETHDRGTLSKKLPVSLFPTGLPPSILKFKH